MSTPSGGQLPAKTLHDRYNEIKQKIRKATEKSGRPGNSICLLAVTKTVPVEKICEVASLGILDFGENKVQEAAAKRPELQALGLPAAARHHFIGGLQTNKARRATELFDVIQSVDRLKLAEELNRISGERGKKQRCLVEVKISSEPSKSGVPIKDASGFVKGFRRYKNLALEGLMTIGALAASRDETRASFREVGDFFLKHLHEFGARPVLSMGMSDDFEIAIEEGSTMIRIGKALFGERK